MPQKQFITPLDEFDPERLTFSQVKDTNHGSKFIYINYDNGVDQGPLFFHLQDYFCFGVDGNYAPNDKQKTTILGYKIPIPLWGTTTKSEHQAKFFDALNAVAAKCAEFLCTPETRKILKKPEWTKEMILPKFMPLWFKRNEELEIEEGTAPVLYAKLRTKGESPDFTITTRFQDTEGEEVDPFTLMNKKFPLDALIKIESIFIGAAPKLQMKLEQVMVHMRDDNDVPSIFKGPPMKKRRVSQEEVPEEEEAPPADETEEQEEEEEEAEAEQDQDMPLFIPVPAPAPAPAPVPTPASAPRQRKRKQL